MKMIGLMLLLVWIFPATSSSQILKGIGKKIEQKVKEKTDRKVDETIDKSLDKAERNIDRNAEKAEEAIGNAVKNKKTSHKKGKGGDADHSEENTVSSDFDFIAGHKTIFSDDFSHDKIGDFPAKWNTNGSGEIVTLGKLPSKWLKVPDNTLSLPEIKSKLPEDFTIEFDLYYPKGTTRPPITFGFTENLNPEKDGIRYKKLFYFILTHRLDQIGYSTNAYSGGETLKKWPGDAMAGKNIRVSISVNKERVRLYMNQDKIFDLPKAFDSALLRNNFFVRSAELNPAPKDGFYIANISIVNAEEDLRSKLLREGKVSTNAILFDVNRAILKPSSHEVISDIAKALNENLSLKIKIIGHTDSDGDASQNLILSQKRATSVKTALVQSYGIVASRIVCEGKGESQQIASNATPEGKMQNRRVEFVKID
jgi:OOP family OmpA-OmpF porin